jgi:hypothetical protein
MIQEYFLVFIKHLKLKRKNNYIAIQDMAKQRSDFCPVKENYVHNNLNISHKLYVEKISYMSNDEPYKCNVCGNLIFNSREELDKHNREKHETTTL